MNYDIDLYHKDSYYGFQSIPDIIITFLIWFTFVLFYTCYERWNNQQT